ncbi:unnamed protein product [Rhizoctonia solani]|uniref:Zn(2)-C6 fungal-type domain-containing protein n=1 Tax=Rhizoctonia solani TaxID=456999 RepID=A0A8H3GD82_9AGAM|nr:unnamed protein product [Rhizoctonia solani]
MSRFISKPGPPPTSCLTCRRRRKKCDLARPQCERCINDGHECLGYENRPRARVNHKDLNMPIPSQTRSFPPLIVGEPLLDSAISRRVEGGRGPNETTAGHVVRPSILGAALLYRISRPTPSANDSYDNTNSSEDHEQSWPQDQSQSIVYSRIPARQHHRVSRLYDPTSSTDSTKNDLIRFIQAFCQSIPPSIDITQMMREGHFARVTNEYHSQRVSYWFMPPSLAIRGTVVDRLRWSKRMTRVMYLTAKVFQALGQDTQTGGSTVKGYIGWIDKFEQRFTTDSSQGLPLNDIGEHLMVYIEATFLKFTIVDNTSGYTLLQKALPKFLQIVAVNPDLYVERPNGDLVVSFPRTLGAPRHELRRFVTYDTIAALLLGVTPLAEYGYDDECSKETPGFDWVHGIPSAFIEIVARVNSWRAGSRVPTNEWEALERRIWAWQSLYTLPKKGFDNKDINVARAAVQEGWRHVLLIYIYMGVCGVSSHDSRVQVSVNRIFDLGESAGSSRIGIHMLPHCIVAGVAARLEKHRIAVYEKLRSFDDTGAWLFSGSQFSQALYHLWHSAGMGGAPVTWDDYVQSRCAVIPI